jgi:hypothetical protein
MQAKVQSEIKGEMSATTLAEKRGVGVDGIRIKYASLFAKGHPLFVAKFDRHALLSEAQIQVLIEGKRIVANTVSDRSTAESVTVKPFKSLEQPTKEAIKSDLVELVALGLAFLIPTLASAFNTYDVSHQVAKDWRVAMFIMVMVMLTPALFIVARMNWVGAFVAFGVVIFEGFCNLSAIYLSLLGKMEYILDGKRGVSSDFLQSVVNLTNSDHRPTALLIGGALAALICGTQLTAFWAIRNRIK